MVNIFDAVSLVERAVAMRPTFANTETPDMADTPRAVDVCNSGMLVGREVASSGTAGAVIEWSRHVAIAVSN
jgi:hypothetical protein